MGSNAAMFLVGVWCVIAAGGCTGQEFRAPVSHVAGDAPPGANGDDPTADAMVIGDDGAGDENTPLTEVCDGFDNNGNDQVDEGTGGGVCTTAYGSGTWVCLRGVLTCRACEPGSTREIPCGCGQSTTDVCDASGFWRIGPCDGCAVEAVIDSCTLADACEPDEERYQRCDTCVGGDTESCGTVCIGSQWRCDNNCEWQQVSGCEIVAIPQCDRDALHYDECGFCGQRLVECDGCFWNYGECLNRGACQPGASKTVPCYGQECVDGYTATVTCDDDCTWMPPTSCNGCSEPGYTDTFEECVPGYSCGTEIVRSECHHQTIDICGEPVVRGWETTTTIQSCPYIPCTPGQSTSVSCYTSAGQCGSATVTCGNDCNWGAESACVANSDACDPTADPIVNEISCGPSACGVSSTVVLECDGCSWIITSRTSCPPCSEGETDSRSCDGGCGTQSRACTDVCEWGVWGACVPNQGNCEAGATEQRECTTYCDLTSHETWTCNGCTWEKTSGCAPDVPPDCVPGTPAENLELCNESIPQCGYRTRECVDCEWQINDCAPCG